MVTVNRICPGSKARLNTGRLEMSRRSGLRRKEGAASEGAGFNGRRTNRREAEEWRGYRSLSRLLQMP